MPNEERTEATPKKSFLENEVEGELLFSDEKMAEINRRVNQEMRDFRRDLEKREKAAYTRASKIVLTS
ncbi:MAG: hypothetical protein K9J12_03210 [Melioribacteraceae bacterium]|nr:hypothetical protein [Melioribacteraceae bacterium]MCF8266297.1 hypothetical protein [Melioribacteraceae bacterium]MCF8413020.1 hypothetical protein [Melioribacteraceae bacterium]